MNINLWNSKLLYVGRQLGLACLGHSEAGMQIFGNFCVGTAVAL